MVVKSKVHTSLYLNGRWRSVVTISDEQTNNLLGGNVILWTWDDGEDFINLEFDKELKLYDPVAGGGYYFSHREGRVDVPLDELLALGEIINRLKTKDG